MDGKLITLDVLASPGCVHCKEFEDFWHTIEKDWPHVTFKHVDVTTPEGQEVAGKFMIFTSPGIIINGELFSTGGFDKEAFITKLEELQK